MRSAPDEAAARIRRSAVSRLSTLSGVDDIWMAAALISRPSITPLLSGPVAGRVISLRRTRASGVSEIAPSRRLCSLAVRATFGSVVWRSIQLCLQYVIRRQLAKSQVVSGRVEQRRERR